MTTEIEHKAVKETDILSKYATALRDTGYGVDNLPQLDLKGGQGHTDYIDFLRPRDMSSPVMTFRDRFNRPGLAILLAGKKPGQMVAPLWSDEKVNTENLCNVLALFQRYTNIAGHWSLGWGNSNDTIEKVYDGYHQNHGHTGTTIMACKACPFTSASISTDLLRDILQGTNPILELGSPLTGTPPALEPIMC